MKIGISNNKNNHMKTLIIGLLTILIITKHCYSQKFIKQNFGFIYL